MGRSPAAILLVAAAALVSGCNHDGAIEDAGATVSRSIPVGAFSALAVAGSYDVRVRSGAKAAVSVTGPEKILDQLVIEVEDGTLQIHPKNQGMFGGKIRWRSHDKVVVDVTAPAIDKASIAGSGDVSFDKIGGESFKGDIAGSGSLALGAVDVQQLKLGIAGSGGVSGSGKADRGDYSIAGSGDIDLGKLESQDLKVSIAGSGGVSAHATGSADISIMGSGDVAVTGGAKCKVSKMGSGDARCS